MIENAVLSPVGDTRESEIAHIHRSFDDEASLFDLDIKIFIEDDKANGPVMFAEANTGACPCDYSGPPSWCHCGPTYGQC